MPDKTAFELVEEFHKTFDVNMPPETRIRIIREEVAEAAEAAAHFLKELCDISYVITGAKVEGFDMKLLDEQTVINAVRLLTMGEAIFHPHIMNEAFDRVHASNMSKLGEDGKPVRREDGKVLKGPNYKEPELIDLI